MLKIEAPKILNKSDMKESLIIPTSEIQLKKRFIQLIRESFYENKYNLEKPFLIDESNIKAIKICFEWAKTNENRRKGIFLYGPYGTGKSAIIEGLYKFYSELHYQNVDELYKPLYRTAVKITTYFGKENDEYWINLCKYCPILFIPEIGREALKIFDRNPIEEILSERYDFKRTIVSSCNDIKNLPYSDPAWAYERIYHMCQVISMKGESKR